MKIARHFKLVFTLVAAMGLCACDAKNPFDSDIEIKLTGDDTPEQQPKTYKIMPIGDSLTEAADPGYRGYLYTSLIDADYNIDFVGVKQGEPSSGGDPDHSGFSGFIIGPDANKYGANNSIMYQLDNDFKIMSVDCDVILLLIGTNDFWNIDYDTTSDGYNPWNDGAIRLAPLLDKMYSMKPNVTILVSNITPLSNDKGYASLFNSQVPDIVKEQKAKGRSCYFVDANSLDWQETDYKGGGDNLHFNASGYQKLAGAFYGVLEPLLKEWVKNEK